MRYRIPSSVRVAGAALFWTAIGAGTMAAFMYTAAQVGLP